MKLNIEIYHKATYPIHACAHMHTYIPTCTHTKNVHTCIQYTHTHTHPYTHVHRHTHIHTHESLLYTHTCTHYNVTVHSHTHTYTDQFRVHVRSEDVVALQNVADPTHWVRIYQGNVNARVCHHMIYRPYTYTYPVHCRSSFETNNTYQQSR